MCGQIEIILAMRDCEEMVRRMKPVAIKLERLSEEIMTTGETILNRLQFIPRTLSQGDIPGGCTDPSDGVRDREHSQIWIPKIKYLKKFMT